MVINTIYCTNLETKAVINDINILPWHNIDTIWYSDGMVVVCDFA